MTTDRRVRTCLVSIGADLLLIGLKGLLATATGSLAIAADAWHSLSDLAVSLVVLGGVSLRLRSERRAAAPAAAGSGTVVKASPGGGGGGRLEAGIAYAVSVAILYVPYEIVSGMSEASGVELRRPGLAIGGMLLCAGIAYLASRLKLTVGRETGSEAMRADGFHSRADMLGSIAVALALLGQLAGIHLEPLAAGLIAVLIGVTGLELFVSSGLALLGGTRIDHGLAERWIERQIARLRPVPRTSNPRNPLPRGTWARRARRAFAALAAAGAACWLATGLTVVETGELGVRTRFGAVVGEPLQPGLHYRLPWPLETLRRVEPLAVRRTELGFRAESGAARSLLWSGGDGEGYRRLPEESLALAGDENLLHASLVVHWRPADAVRALFEVNRLEEVVRRLAESAFREVVATEPFDRLLGGERAQVLERTRNLLRTEAARLGVGIEVMAVLFHEVRPPPDVANAFRDVFSAREDQLKLLSQAQSHRNQSLPSARGQSEARRSDASAHRAERRLRAEGDARHFTRLAAAFAAFPQITGLRLYLETAEATLAGRKKIVADPRANRGGYHLWLFAPDRPPAPVGRDDELTEHPE